MASGAALMLWIRFKSSKPDDVNYPIKVSSAGCNNIFELIEVVHNELKLRNHVQKITLHLDEISQPLDPGGSLTSLGVAGATSKTPIIVRVDYKPSVSSLITAEAGLLSQDHPRRKRLSRWQELNSASHIVTVQHIVEDKQDVVHSSTIWGTILSVFTRYYSPFVQDSQLIPTNTFESLVATLATIYSCYGQNMVFQLDINAKRIHLVAPILWAVASVVPGVTVNVNKTMQSKHIETQSYLDFVLSRGSKRICIVMAKREDYDLASAQNLLGCEIAADLDDNVDIYGIVTDFNRWLIFHSEDEHILFDEHNYIEFDGHDVPTRDGLMKVVGKIHAILL